MVRVIVVALFVLLLAFPALAQDDFPRIEMSLGYGNIGFPCCKTLEQGFLTGDSERHSGFASTQGLNFTRVFGLENYFGYYSLGSRVSLIANMVGAKITGRTERATPYFVAGIGVGYMTDEVSFGTSNFATRFGPGVDIRMNESMAFKIDLTRMSFKLGQITAGGGNWHSGWNVSTGVVFNISQ
jgi:opacity protein-like surface antigen